MLNDLVTRFALLGAAASLGACTTLPVTTDVNPHESLAICHTYSWAQEHIGGNGGPGAAFANPVNADRLRAAIGANLAAKGLVLAPDAKSADCVVGYAMGTRQVFDDFGYGWGWGGGWGRRGWGYGGWGWGWGGPGGYVENEGRIAVDLFDAHTRSAIWHASVEQNVAGLTGPNAEAKIDAATAAIFAKFPVIGAGPVPAPPPPRAAT